MSPWWRHQMETFSALLAICAGNSPVPGEFPAQRPVTRSFDLFFDLRPNKRLSKQSWGWWFETPSCPLWRHRNAISILLMVTGHMDGVDGFLWCGVSLGTLQRYRWEQMNPTIPNKPERYHSDRLNHIVTKKPMDWFYSFFDEISLWIVV